MCKEPSNPSKSQPPECLRQQFRRWRGCSVDEIQCSSDLIDPRGLDGNAVDLSPISVPVEVGCINQAYCEFAPSLVHESQLRSEYQGFEVKKLPGLMIFPDFFPFFVQMALLDTILHRDLSNPAHKTNLHLFHDMVYPDFNKQHDDNQESIPGSFFAEDSATMFQPKDGAIHKSMTIAQMLQRKLRWMTLGGQYDWTAKVYPDEEPPVFPEDVSRLLKCLFPDVDAQAAIVNFYSPGDNLSIHRDISEECDRGLISISIGCDALFLVGNEDGSESTTIRLRSGDVVLMSGPSRYAFHAVPKVLEGTCPIEIASWPFSEGNLEYEHWKDWLNTKRINLNVRQMKV